MGDRWSGADDGIVSSKKAAAKSGVALLGMGSFVKGAAPSAPEAQNFGKIEMFQSKKEQRSAQATVLMPPPPPSMGFRNASSQGNASASAPSPHAPPPASSATTAAAAALAASLAAAGLKQFKPPAWASSPVPGARLQAFKDGTLVQSISLDKSQATVFGRHDSNNVILDHGSVSRQHAAICFHGMTGKCLLLDLGSAHGTFVDGRRVEQMVPTELIEGGEVRFAASTRSYIYSVHQAPTAAAGAQASTAAASEAAGSRPSSSLPLAGDLDAAELSKPRAVHRSLSGARQESQPTINAQPTLPSGSKRPRVSFAGGDDSESSEQLNQVVGFSDSRHFTALVGPKPASSSEAGRFANAINITTVLVPHSSKPTQAPHETPPAKKSPSAAAGKQQQRNLAGDLHRTGSASLYDTLPPPQLLP